jgi:ATP-dependent DNA helicase DinG
VTADERFEPLAIQDTREAIEEAGGNEVFLVGRLGAGGKIEQVAVGARGTEDLVPILRPHLQQGDMVIHNHPSGELSPSRPDIVIASRLGNDGIGFAIVDNAVSHVYVVAEPVAGREIAPIEAGRLALELSPGGGLSRIYPQYEQRESQVGMLRLVCRAFNGDEIAAVEAGTGVGKSLAYLLPALSWAQTNNDRVVVSTNTINLQQQLVEKDIPLAKRVLQADLKVVLVKGRGNYLCANRLREVLDEVSLFKEEDPELQAILEWSRTTATGDRTDLSFYPGDETWSKICSEADTCLGLRCRHREGCFVLKARREAASAKILVANHHLLFSDLSLRMAGSGFDDPAVLPPFRRIILDEAHNIERAATSFFSRALSRPAILKCLGRIYRKRKNRVTGHYPLLVKLLGRKAAVKMIPELTAAIQERAEEVDAAAIPVMGEEGNLLLDFQGRSRAGVLASPLANLSAAISALVDDLQEVLDKAPVSDTENLLWDCKVQVSRLAGLAKMADRFQTADPGANDILWMEAVRGRGSDRYSRFVITPLDVAPLMREAVFEPMKTVVMTSATLTVAGGFEFWAGRIGLTGSGGREPIAKTFPSPFNYRENVLLGVPTDAPAPTQPGYKEFLSSFITEALRASGGSGLVLFTSYALLRDVHSAVQPALALDGIRIFKQGDDDRARLLDRFRDDTGSVLFATDSFWEGVDAPGETLQLVILCRLPFRVPSEPVLMARMAAIEERGGNPFLELSLPDAVVRLRQGFGRLMRRHDDRGVVLILDSRVVSKRYGEVFLDSLPSTRRAIAGSGEVLDAVSTFFRAMK